MSNNKQNMKKVLLITTLIVMISGCTENTNTKRSDANSNELPFSVGQFIWENHKYLYYGNGGLIHSESCKCKLDNNEQR